MKIFRKLLLIFFCLFFQSNAMLPNTLLSDPVFRAIADRMNIAYVGKENVIDKIMEIYQVEKNDVNRAIMSGILQNAIEKHKACGVGKIDQWTDNVLSDFDCQVRAIGQGANCGNKK